MQPKQIALENFEGPLDLLLYLVKKGELNIYDVLLQQITAQIREMADAESLIPTASLLLMKSEALLPQKEQSDEEAAEPDPGFELIHHLADYCRFRKAALDLVSLEKGQQDRFGRGWTEPLDGQPRSGLHHLSLSDLGSLFEGVMERAAENRPKLIEKETWSVSEAMDHLRALKERVDFYTLFSIDQPKGRLIATFLALLELVKIGELGVISEEERVYITP